MAILVPGWSRACPWLNLSKNFDGFNLFFKTCWTFTYNETERKITIKNVPVEPISASYRQSKTSHASKMLAIVGICVNTFNETLVLKKPLCMFKKTV